MRVVPLLIILLLFTSIPLTNVFADKIETMGGGIYHRTNPLVCIMEPSDELRERFYSELLPLTYEAVLQWQTDMKNYTDGNWWMNMQIVELDKHFDKYTYDFKQCNIFVEYDKSNTGQHIDNSSALGFTQIDFSKSIHQWSYVMIYTEAVENDLRISLCIGCDEKQEAELKEKNKVVEMSSDAIKKVLLHELGHALGIGHYIEDLQGGNNIQSIMYPNMNPFAKDNIVDNLPLADLEMLRQIYESDGFGGLKGYPTKEVGTDIILEGIIEQIAKRCPDCEVVVGSP